MIYGCRLCGSLIPCAHVGQLDPPEHPDPPKLAHRLRFPVPPGAPCTRCRSCSAPVIWIVTAAGKRMPVDAATHESHFSTCPNATMHRVSR